MFLHMGGMRPVQRPQNESSTNLFTQDVGKFSTTNPPSVDSNLSRNATIRDKPLIDLRICSRLRPRDNIPLSWIWAFNWSTRHSWESEGSGILRRVSSILSMIPRKMVTGSKSGLLELMAKLALLRRSSSWLVISSTLSEIKVAPGMFS